MEAKPRVRSIALLNSSVMTANENMSYHTKKISPEDARAMLHRGASSGNQYSVVSYVNHPSTARLMERTLGIPVPLSKEDYYAKPGEVALCFKFESRIPWGKELSDEELDAMKYSYLLVYHTDLWAEDEFDVIIGDNAECDDESEAKRARAEA